MSLFGLLMCPVNSHETSEAPIKKTALRQVAENPRAQAARMIQFFRFDFSRNAAASQRRPVLGFGFDSSRRCAVA